MWDKVTFIQETWPRKEGLRRSWERDTGKSKTPSMHVHPFKTSTPVWILSKFYYLLTIKIDVTSRRNIYIHTCLCSLFLKNFHVNVLMIIAFQDCLYLSTTILLAINPVLDITSVKQEISSSPVGLRINLNFSLNTAYRS